VLRAGLWRHLARSLCQRFRRWSWCYIGTFHRYVSYCDVMCLLVGRDWSAVWWVRSPLLRDGRYVCCGMNFHKQLHSFQLFLHFFLLCDCLSNIIMNGVLKTCVWWCDDGSEIRRISIWCVSLSCSVCVNDNSYKLESVEVPLVDNNDLCRHNVLVYNFWKDGSYGMIASKLEQSGTQPFNFWWFCCHAPTLAYFICTEQYEFASAKGSDALKLTK